MYFPFFKLMPGGKRSVVQPQTIYSEFPYDNTGNFARQGNFYLTDGAESGNMVGSIFSWQEVAS